ncbi:hypothetical protein NQ318_018795 [Aromia moschata]|uniref:Uncharacterized protein n=1 Tax=Aromia moschata TaxID=1265417 RepID=A0AAV8ZFP1_9CUCU|nr:hypothetical protein NQ318_018795 [Aromia moschata]
MSGEQMRVLYLPSPQFLPHSSFFQGPCLHFKASCNILGSIRPVLKSIAGRSQLLDFDHCYICSFFETVMLFQDRLCHIDSPVSLFLYHKGPKTTRSVQGEGIGYGIRQRAFKKLTGYFKSCFYPEKLMSHSKKTSSNLTMNERDENSGYVKVRSETLLLSNFLANTKVGTFDFNHAQLELTYLFTELLTTSEFRIYPQEIKNQYFDDKT